MMSVSTPLRSLRRLLPLIALLLFGTGPLLAQKATMTFTTVRNNTATKNWTPDTTSVERNGTSLVIRGMTSTGRTDHPYQTLHIVVNNYTGPGTYRLTANTYFEDLFGSRMIKTDFGSGEITLTSNPATGGFSGEFEMYLWSNPPNLERFSTRVRDGVLNVTPDSLVLEAITKDDPLRGSAGEKAKKIKVVAKDELGGLVKDVEISVLNPVAGGASALGKTNASGELLYSFDIADSTAASIYDIKFAGAKPKYKKPKDIIKKIDVSSRYWVYKCGGGELITFDAGAGNQWKKREAPSNVLDASGSNISLSSVLSFSGKMSIDTNRFVVDYDGQFFIPNVPLPGGSTGNFDLNSEKQGEFRLSCDRWLKFARSQAKKKFWGITATLEEMELVEDAVETALKLKIKFELEGMGVGCAPESKEGTQSIAGGMVVALSGPKSLSLDVVNGLYYRPYFCMNEFKLAYDFTLDKWTAEAKATLKGSLETSTSVTLKGDMTIIKDKLDAAHVDIATSFCYGPLGNIPLCVAGGRLGFSGLSTGQSTPTSSINFGGLFRTADDILFSKFPAIKAHLGENPIAEINVDGKWEFPNKYTGEIKLTTLHIDLISEAKPWQITASGKLELDATKSLTGTATVQAFHFGGDDFVLTGTGSISYTWYQDHAVTMNFGTTTVKIPDIPDDAVDKMALPVLKIMRNEGLIPATLGTGSSYITISQQKGAKGESYLDVSSNPVGFIRRLGKMGVKIERSSQTNQRVKFSIISGGKELFSLGGRQRKKGVQTQGVDGRDLPGPFVAHALDTFMVSPGLERMNIFIDGKASVPPVAYLIAPNGTRHDVTTSDSSIIVPQDAPANVRWLTVVNPAPGAWVLGLVNPKPTDSVTVLLPAGDVRAFDIDATSASRKVTVTWNSAGLTADDLVAVHLDPVDGGEGVLVGMANATDGRFDITLDDSYSECSYKVRATLSGNGYLPVSANATGEFSTGKTILPAPQNIVATPRTPDLTTVTWTASPDTSVVNYMVYVRGVETRDSLLAIVPASLTTVDVIADTSVLRSLFIRSANAEGVTGCAANVSSVGVLSVEDESLTGANASISGVTVVPNPASGTTSIRWRSESSAPVVVEVRSLTGVTVARFDAVRAAEGTQEIQWNTDGVPAGTYLVVVHSGTTMRTAKVVVVR